MNAVRTCIGCRVRSDRDSLVRFVERNGEIVLDASATLDGRGAWVHASLTCFDAAVSRKSFGRALRQPSPDTSDARQQLEQTLVPNAPVPTSDKG